MNWLAHLYLARESDRAMVGAMLGDFVRGRVTPAMYGDIECREITLHRRIDAFTDAHPAVRALRIGMPDGVRRYAGIVLDLWFDHLLARDWPRHAAPGTPPLDAFATGAYAALLARRGEYPPRLAAIVPGWVANDGLTRYRERASVDRAVQGIARRMPAGRAGLLGCLADLSAREAALEQAFDTFFPALGAYAGHERARLSAALAMGER